MGRREGQGERRAQPRPVIQQPRSQGIDHRQGQRPGQPTDRSPRRHFGQEQPGQFRQAKIERRVEVIRPVQPQHGRPVLPGEQNREPLIQPQAERVQPVEPQRPAEQNDPRQQQPGAPAIPHAAGLARRFPRRGCAIRHEHIIPKSSSTGSDYGGTTKDTKDTKHECRALRVLRGASYRSGFAASGPAKGEGLML